ncbi:ribonuclease 3-like protein 3 [Benincasa hispida]|uniref:ribonuclease 3-like protein 3 n=1 Tax=Benincasa hispida TaxID=102211 RepID=UPI00190209F9|nr:ribonuclease 3-like protein 3 [Benincasa hispida]
MEEEEQRVVFLEEEGSSGGGEAVNGGDSAASLDGIEAILNYEFRDKRLLEEAFTDASYSPENCSSFERLEYVGDSVLNFLITREQYFSNPNLSPGSLTRLRAANVDTEKLARVAITHGFHRYLRHNKPDLHPKIEEFIKSIEDYPLHSNGMIKAPKVLADIVESTIGAVFADSNSIETVWKIFKDLMEPLITLKTMKKHPMTELTEICQKRNLNLEFVDCWEERKEVQVFIDKQLVGKGSYRKKLIAQNRAAKDALNNLDRVLGEFNQPCQPM